jgi:hypothetical protein
MSLEPVESSNPYGIYEDTIFTADYTILPIIIKLCILGISSHRPYKNVGEDKIKEYFGRFKGDSDKTIYLIFPHRYDWKFYLQFGKSIKWYHHMILHLFPREISEISNGFSGLFERGNWTVNVIGSTDNLPRHHNVKFIVHHNGYNSYCG